MRSTISFGPPDTFLTAADVPPNLLKLKRGTALRWKRRARTVVRVGYRKTADDYVDEAKEMLRSVAGQKVIDGLQFFLEGDRFGRASMLPELDNWIARRLVERDKFGGPDRGILVRDAPGLDLADSALVVYSTRVVRLGTYYPPSRGRDPDDYEDGGLAEPRSVILVRTDYGEVISGDLCTCAGFIREGAFVHTDTCARQGG